jgi:hypothetical protein
MVESNGHMPAPEPIAVDPECVIPYLANQLAQERAALNARISDLLYENALKAGYIDQLKKQMAEMQETTKAQ